MDSLSADACTTTTCPVNNGFLSEQPSLVGTVILLALFAALVPINLWIGGRSRTTTFTITLILGLVLEVVGYIGRLLLRSDLTSRTYYLLFVLGTTTGPVFITAAIYTIIPHLVVLYGSDVSVLQRPVWLSYFFLIFDIFALAFQTLGSAFEAEGFDKLEIQQGTNVLIAGLGFQLLSIIVFFIIYFYFMRHVVHNKNFLDPRFADVYLSAKFRTALLCVQISLAFILVRTLARIVQLSSGLDSTLSQSQVYIPVLDGGLVLSAVILLTIILPGPAFGRAWGVTSPSSTKARRYSAALFPEQRSPGSSLHQLHRRSFPSPRGYGYNLAAGKEPRSPPPSVTAHKADLNETAAGSSRRYSPSWTAHKRQHSASSVRATEMPPYERPANNYTRVPYIPPQTGSLSQQYGHGSVVESQVVVAAGGSDGSRTGGSGSNSAGRRARQSPRAYQEDLVRHDAIW